MWRFVCGLIALVSLTGAAFASDEIGERFMFEYKKNYPGEKWELIGTAKMPPGDNIRVYFQRESENTLRTAVCAKTRDKDWVCEVGQNLPEGSLVLK